MPEKDLEIDIPVPDDPELTTAYNVETPVVEALDIAVPVPTITRASAYNAETPVSITEEHQIMIPTVTLTETVLVSGGYVLEDRYQIMIPGITLGTDYNAETPPSIDGDDHQVMIPTVELATRYTAETPVSIDGGDHQIMIPTISEPALVYWVWTAVDSYLSVEDPATYTDQTTEANNPTANDFDIFPPSPAALDGFLIGMEHPYWDRIRIDIGTAGVGTWTVEWLYWNGSAWVGISNVDDDTLDFTVSGRNTVTFDQPTLWGWKTISGAERYWVFMRILSLDSLSVRPLGTQFWAGVISSRLSNTRQTMNEQAGIEHMTFLLNTPARLLKGISFIWQFKLVDYRDAASQRSLLNPTVSASIDGGAFATVSEAVSEAGHGWYYITISALLADCDRMILLATAPGASQCDLTIEFFE